MMVFFDIDETLLNQRLAERRGLEQFFAVFGAELPQISSLEQLLVVWRGLRERHLAPFLSGQASFAEHRRERLRSLFGPPGKGLTVRELDARFAVYLDVYRAHWSLFDDVRPVLERLAASHRLGVISNGHGPQQRAKLAQTGILELFEAVVISEDVGASKPDEAIFRHGLAYTARDREMSVYVGDRRDADARASARCGFRGIWLNRWSEAETGADDIETIANLYELLEMIATTRSERATSGVAR